MARIRSIKPEFPQSETIGKLTRDARLLFIQIWTLVDDEGRARAAPRMLASLLYPYDDDAPKLVESWLSDLEQHGCIRRYEVEGAQYLEVVNWLKHQKIDKPSKSRIPPFSEGSSKPREWSRSLAPDLGTGSLDQGLPEAKASSPGDPPGHDSPWPKDFREQFWAAYPRKVGKAAAIKALETIRKRGAVPFDRLLAGLRAFVATNPDPQFTPHPLTWLHQGRWDDELAGGNVVRLDLGGKFWAALDSPQWQAWTEYRGGRAPPLDRNGGWLFDAEWPPGFKHNEAAE